MASVAGALVLNIGTLSRALDRRDAARRARRRTRPACRSCSIPSASARRRSAPRRRSGSSTRSTSRSCAGTRRRSRRSPGSRRRSAASRRSARRAAAPTIARTAAARLGVVASVTGPVDHVSDGDANAGGRERRSAARDDHRLGLHVDRAHRLLRRRAAGRVDAARRSRSPRSASRPRTQRASATGPGTFHARLYDALYALTPERARRRARHRATREAPLHRRGRRRRRASRRRAARP